MDFGNFFTPYGIGYYFRDVHFTRTCDSSRFIMQRGAVWPGNNEKRSQISICTCDAVRRIENQKVAPGF